MTAATVNKVDIAEGVRGLEFHDVSFAATGDTYATGKAIRSYTFSVKTTTGTNANGYKLSESGGTFTLTCDGTPNTAVRVNLQIWRQL